MSKQQPPKNSAKPAARPQAKAEFVEVGLSKEAEARLPTVANVVNVSGTTDMLTLNFFYVHPQRLSRIEDFGGRPEDGEVRGDTFYINSEPVAQIAIPLTAGTELIVQMFRTIMFGAPRMINEINSFSERLGRVTEAAQRIEAAANAARAAEQAEVGNAAAGKE